MPLLSFLLIGKLFFSIWFDWSKDSLELFRIFLLVLVFVLVCCRLVLYLYCHKTLSLKNFFEVVLFGPFEKLINNKGLGNNESFFLNIKKKNNIVKRTKKRGQQKKMHK